MSDRIGFYVEVSCHKDEFDIVQNYVLRVLPDIINDEFDLNNVWDDTPHEVEISPHQCNKGSHFHWMQNTLLDMEKYHKTEMERCRNELNKLEKDEIERIHKCDLVLKKSGSIEKLLTRLESVLEWCRNQDCITCPLMRYCGGKDNPIKYYHASCMNILNTKNEEKP